MINEIPVWWLALSGVFFAINIAFFIGLIVLVMRVIKLLETVGPKVTELSGQVSTLIVKVDRVADRVEEVAESVKETVETVGGRSRAIATTVDLVTQTAGRQFERFSPYVAGVVAAMRLFKGFQEMRATRGSKHEK